MTSKTPSTSRFKAANDNAPGKNEPQVTCGLDSDLSILPGEAALIARYFDNLLMTVANDNEE